jgi:hypothetical protein
MPDRILNRDLLTTHATIAGGMRFAFDESGTFQFPRSGFDSCSIGAVACPDSSLDHIGRELRRLRRLSELDEIHAKELPGKILHEVCGILGASDILWAAVYTDSRVFPLAQQADFRRRQVEKADEGIAASVSLAGDPERTRIALQTRNRIFHDTRVTAQEYLEFLVLFPRALGDILVGALRAYRDLSWTTDFAHLHFESDRKLTSKLSMGEKTLTAALPVFLANNDQFTLPIPAEWPPDHAFLREHYDATRQSVTVPRVLGDGIDFVDSKTSTLVQVADVVAHVTRRAAGDPSDSRAQDAYRLLRRRGYSTAATPIRIFSDRLGPTADPRWFTHLG